MILKGSQRGFGQNLAAHLMKMDDNEHVELHELRGFAADDLKGAFKEAEAVSLGTKCRQYLFSLSLNPPQDAYATTADFEAAINTIEGRLGLTGQPRAIVFHEKEGHRHAHCVWSRIDAEAMTAKHLPFFKNKLMEVSRNLYLDHGWKMPDGIADSSKRDPSSFTLAEWQQAKRQGLDPRWLKASVQECWTRSDSGAAFGRSLEEYGLHLAKGDKRGFVVMDYTSDVHSLPRLLGVKTKEVRTRLGEGDKLPTVAECQDKLAERMKSAIKRHIAESRERFRGQSDRLSQAKAAMTSAHRDARKALEARQSLEWIAECKERAARLPRGLRGLWHRITGEYGRQRTALEDEAQRSRERQAAERQALIDRQRQQRAGLQAQFKELRTRQAQQLLSLRKDVGRYLALSRGRDVPAAHVPRARTPGVGLGLRLER